MEVKFVTIATHNERYFDVLQQSAKRNGISLDILGWGKEYVGHHIKDDWMIEYLQTLPDDDNLLIVFIDGFDSILLSYPDEFIQKWNKIKKQFYSNKNSAPLEVIVSRDYDPSWLNNPIFAYTYVRTFIKCQNMYINAGQFMGTKKGLLRLMETAKKYRSPKISSNQLIWALAYQDNPNLFHIDEKM